LTGLAGVEADIILTSITFQHIRPSRGLAIMEALLARLSVGGAAWLHVLVAGASNQVAGVSDKDQVLREARQLIEMNVYPADQLLLLLARFSPELHLAFSPAGGQLGADIMLVRRG
jgi:hypothetical protein